MEVSSFTGPMLALAGVVLQFAVRQFKLIPEIIYWTLVVMLGVFVYWLTSPDPFAGGTKLAILHFVSWMIGASAAIRGGSSATDAIAKNVMKENPNKAASLLVPVTDSM